MTRLEVLRAIGLLEGRSEAGDVCSLSVSFSCPPGMCCNSRNPCLECWRRWLNEETRLEVVTK